MAKSIFLEQLALVSEVRHPWTLPDVALREANGVLGGAAARQTTAKARA